MLKKFVAGVIILLFLLATLFPMVYGDSPTLNKTIYVDDDGGADYTTIQDAINAAESGDTIFVYGGKYNENISIAKSINLIGEDRNITVINNCGLGHVIHITADGVYINGFTVQNSKLTQPGILIQSDNNIIVNNIICNNSFGCIQVKRSSNNIISNNIINNSRYNGIYLDMQSNDNYIENNIISNHTSSGIWLLKNCDNNIIRSNIVASNYHCGIAFTEGMSNCEITGNIIRDNKREGIHMYISSNNIVSNNSIEDNGGMGMLLDYHCDSNFISFNTIRNNNLNYENDIGGLGIGTSQNNLVTNNYIGGNKREEIYLYYSKGIQIYDNIIDCSREDICLEDSSETIISYNNINARERGVAIFSFKVEGSLNDLLETIIKSYTNEFIRNYWGRMRVLPKPINGKISYWIGPPGASYSITLPWVIFDRHPAREPYDISLPEV